MTPVAVLSQPKVKWSMQKSLPFFQSSSWQLVLCLLVEQTGLESGFGFFFFPSRTIFRFPLSPLFHLYPVIRLSVESVACRHFVSCKAEVVVLCPSENVACLVILFYSDHHIFKTKGPALSIWTRREYINLIYFCMHFQGVVPDVLGWPGLLVWRGNFSSSWRNCRKHASIFWSPGWF